MKSAPVIVRRIVVLSVFPILALVAASQAACSPGVGNGVPKLSNRDVTGFHEISVNGSMTVDITGGEPQRVTIRGDENLVALVHAELHGDTLAIWTEGNIQPTQPIVVTIRAPDLHGVDVQGSGKVSVKHITGSDFAVASSGSATISLDDMTLSKGLSVAASGSGHIVAKGHASDVSIASKGSADVDTLGIVANNVSLDVSGSGDFKVHASGQLSIGASGSARIAYRGAPKLSVEQSGSASVRVME